jgi:hypothetical protein
LSTTSCCSSYCHRRSTKIAKKCYKSQQLAYQASSLVQLSASQTAALAVNKTQSFISLNSAMQPGLILAINQSNTETRALLIQAVLKAQASASNAAFSFNQSSSFAQSASSLASSQVSQQLLLLNNMVELANSTSDPVSKFISSKAIANGTQQAISFLQSQISIQLTAINAINNALLYLNDVETQLQILQLIFSQTIAYTTESETNVAQLIQLVTDMKSIETFMSNAFNSTLILANAAKEAATRADAAQAIALQAAIKASRLALCYPNPSTHGGMCAASPDNSSFTPTTSI